MNFLSFFSLRAKLKRRSSMRHRNVTFCGACGPMRHRILQHFFIGARPTIFLWRMGPDAPQNVHFLWRIQHHAPQNLPIWTPASMITHGTHQNSVAHHGCCATETRHSVAHLFPCATESGHSVAHGQRMRHRMFKFLWRIDSHAPQNYFLWRIN